MESRCIPQDTWAGFKATGISPVDHSEYPVERLCSRIVTSYNAQNLLTKRERSIATSNNSDATATSNNSDATATSNNSDAIATSNNLQHNSNQQHSKMQILDSVEDGAPTFEDILSRWLRQTPSVQKSETRRKIDTNSAVITNKDFLDLVAVHEQEIEKEVALKAQQIAAKGKKKCSIKNKNLEETGEPPAKQALL
ncbi:hypothetical protein AVEN_211515-1 [Araneus ventricosus]|uniref:Uncharacterized protein n=1 Tax=Araneus ventricosus TaxID=182803 RepID=A0A4Y2I8M2_ARAVE|nr:hypothetical protein AVEN_211515-1 [Araneus ventricosus]